MSGEVSYSPTKLALLSILLCSMLMLMGGAAVAPALPQINEVFPDSTFMVSLIITLPSLSVAIFGFAMGAIADRFGKVRTLVISLLIFVVAGAAGFVLDSLYMILAARFLLGVGIAGITGSVTALITDYYTGVSRTKVLSYQSAAMGVGVLILEYTGGTLAEISWREPFLVYMIGLPIMILVISSLREPARRAVSSTDRESRPVNRGVVATCYAAIFLMMTMAFLMPTKIPYYLDEIGVSSSVVGLFLGIHGVSSTALSLMHRRITDVISPITSVAVGFLLMGVGLCLLLISGTVPMAVLTMIATGAGMGFTTPAIVGMLASEVTGSNSGTIMGGYGTCLNLGQFSISLISVPLFAAVGSSYPSMFAVMGVIAFVVSALFLIKSRTSRSVRQ